jgi:hypothetical protein
VPTTAPPQSQPATPADAGEYAEYGDAGDAGDESGEYDEYGGCGEYGDAGDESVPTEEPVFEALPDGRYAALLVSMNTDAGVVGLDVLDLLVDPDGGQHFSNPESRVRLMYMTSDVELTGVVAPPSPNVYWATVEGGFVTGLEPAS